jgi:hypothetical protein
MVRFSRSVPAFYLRIYALMYSSIDSLYLETNGCFERQTASMIALVLCASKNQMGTLQDQVLYL